VRHHAKFNQVLVVNEMPSMDIRKVESVCLAALKCAGVSEPHAWQQVSLLLEAELRGHPSHGLLRLPRIIERIHNDVIDPNATGLHQWRGEALLDVDGQDGLGPVVCTNALDAICERASRTGMAATAIRRNNHLGMLAWYAERVARQGLVLLGFTISEALVHPWQGTKAMLGTNPIAIGVPADPEPFIFDMATSLISMGKIHDYAHRGESIPEGWAIDAQGMTTTNPKRAKAGAIAPFGGAKGFALGLAIEVIVGCMTSSALGRKVRGTLDSDRICNKGDLFIVMEPAEGTLAAISGFLDDVRHSPSADPAESVRVPGDRAREEWQKRSMAVSVAPEVWSEIRRLANAGGESSVALQKQNRSESL
jgi:LDH2 family malate/lactate/ureidoglycolate dehydrogenase